MGGTLAHYSKLYFWGVAKSASQMEGGVGRYRIKAARIAKGTLQIEERSRAQHRIYVVADFAIRRHQLLISHRLFLEVLSHLAMRKAN